MRKIAVVLALVFSSIMVGCSALPTSGPVEYLQEVEPHEQRPKINVAPLPPEQDASAQMIIEGFLAAMESSADDYAVAKQYLTPEASDQWDPEASVLVYSKQSTYEQGPSNSISLRLEEVGNLDGSGFYTSRKPHAVTINLRLQQVDGQLRISNPMPGIVLSSQRFERSFAPVKAYFVALDESSVVPQQVFLQAARLNLDEIVKTVLRGPNKWLAPVVKNYAQDASLSSETWIDNDKIARVSLKGVSQDISPDQAELLAAQLLAALTNYQRIQGVKIKVDDLDLRMSGSKSGTLLAKDCGLLKPVTEDAYKIVGVATEKPVEIDDGGRAVPLPQFDGIPELLVSQVAANDSNIAATSNSDSQIWLSKDSGQAEKIFDGESISSLQFTGDYLWWLADTASGTSIFRRSGDGTIDSQEIIALRGRKISALSVCQNNAYAALVVNDEYGQLFGMVRINNVDGLKIDGWREVPLNWKDGKITSVKDAAWASGNRIVYLGSSASDGKTIAFATDMDAAIVSSLGPYSEVEAVKIIAAPVGSLTSTMVLTNTGRVLKFEDQYRWPVFANDLSNISYAIDKA